MDDKKTDLLDQLFERYSVHPECAEEIRTLVISSGNEKRFLNTFTKNTLYLTQFGHDVILYSRNFEKLKNAKDLYSMKLKIPQLNLRIVYTYKKDKLAILLVGFCERSDSKETYDKYIPVAYKRMKEMEEKEWRII